MDAYQIYVIVGLCARHVTYPSGNTAYGHFYGYLVDGRFYNVNADLPKGRIAHMATFVPEPVVKVAMEALINDAEMFGSVVWC